MVKKIVWVGVIFSIGAIALLTQAQDKEEAKYDGVNKCKICHNTDKMGKQHDKWSKTKHANAYKILATDDAKKTAEKKGVKDPQNDEKCVKCHVTAFGVDEKLLGDKFNKEDGVQCEACHGPGSLHAKTAIKDKEGSKKLIKMPDEKLCKTCHNEESPNYKEFKYEEFKKEIEHSKPKEEKK